MTETKAIPDSTPTRIEVGAMMPRYEARTLDGKISRLSDRRGKVVLLNLWATWCGPCRYEIPELKALHQELSPRGFEVVGVSLDNPGTESEIREFVSSRQISYPILHDGNGVAAELFNAYVIPFSALVDRNGRIRWMHFGPVTRKDPALQKALAAAL